ncbi:UFD1-domain-containing protein [Dichomitus squalens LYAD-421 SS1]|uniref:UFD1-domain-containing protein n=1 Tax=Dichomitus squalens TaxID=114155 RepID=A0A4Q9N6L9_9APHY|nr:UFD1-domain-containing protein [Dichomitus squalens LYAD-421 SS1]EJF66068.1 UFD1-domain-containing protein [Dichomitus squalens LYAD-421 SS1]TBU35737.1 UFD1-domain-containing protein [Dichomitus squalens]
MDFFDQDHFGGGGPGGLFAQLAQGFGGMAARRIGRPNPRAYDEYFKAYSVAMLPGRPRDNVSYGGKIIMPPSVLANLTNMELESPWMFKLRNPGNPAASTHAGVLEFIAEEGCVHLPRWMMKTLRLEEGDPIRITGCELPKGKLVKLQAQSVDFLEISDPKAVLEQALRNFSALTQGDIIEISYNSIVFGLLVMETQPGGEGISVLDTDLEVDFAAPVGYVEPERPKAAPQPTMRDKLNIDLSSSTPGSSRPSSSMGFAGAAAKGPAISKGGDQWESFKGKGETLQGRKTKGKGISHRKAEAAPEGSKIIRTDKQRIVTADALDNDAYVPAPLNLPFGQLFFGFNIQPYVPPSQEPSASPSQSNSFAGTGNTLTGRSQPSSSDKGKSKAQSSSTTTWGSGGQTLGRRPTQPASSTPRSVGAGGASVPVLPSRGRAQQQQAQRERSPTPDFGVDDDEDIPYYSDD